MNDNGSDAPLDAAWWQEHKSFVWPPDGIAILAPYGETVPGQELLNNAVFEHAPDWDWTKTNDGSVRIYHWDVFATDDRPPEPELDEDIEKIDRMQDSLGVLDDDARYVRLQIACLQRCWWEFPRNIDLILDGISTGRVNLDAGVSCEPPWAFLLGVLRHRRGHLADREAPYSWRYLSAATDYDPLHAPRQELARAYIRILSWWTFEGDLGCLKQDLPQHADLAETVYRRLGRPDMLKRLYVAKLQVSLAWESFPYLIRSGKWFPDFQGFTDMIAAYDEAIRREIGENGDAIGRMIGPIDLCHHGLFRHIDRQIASIGAGRPVRLPDSGAERTRIHSAVTAYVHALGSWLTRRPPDEAITMWPSSESVVHKTYDTLAQATPHKKWLVACLWKQMRRNQGNHGRGPLDSEPERFAIPKEVLRI